MARKKQRIYTVWKHSTNGRWFVSDGGAGAATSAKGYKTAKEAEESAWDLIYRRGEDYPKANVVVEKSRNPLYKGQSFYWRSRPTMKGDRIEISNLHSKDGKIYVEYFAKNSKKRPMWKISARDLTDAKALALQLLMEEGNRSFDAASKIMEDFEPLYTPEGQLGDYDYAAEYVMSQKNPRGKHMSCGSLSAKKCRQLQHVYESARDRGFSKKRAAKQAWGAVGGREYNAKKKPSRKKNAFMEPEYYKGLFYDVENTHGESTLVPADLIGGRADVEFTPPDLSDFEDYIEGKPERFERVKGWFVRLSASGYMDATEWSGPFKTKAEARKFVEDHYEVDPDTGDELEYEENRSHNPKEDYFIAFDVYLGRKNIDTVFYSKSSKVTADEVRRALIQHDGYDPGITVKKRRAKRKNNPGTNTSIKQLKSFLSR